MCKNCEKEFLALLIINSAKVFINIISIKVSHITEIFQNGI